MNCFKAYDIRGVWGKDLNEETVYRIGYFLPDIVGFNNILVGQDIRLSSDTVMYNLAKGLNDRGVSVDFVGLSTTPLIYWTTAKMGYHASVMITASHNPSNHNGLKISGLNATPIGYDSGLDKLESLVESDKITTIAEKRGIINKIDIYEQYINFLSQYKVDISNLKIAVDCSNGMSSLFIKQLLGDTPVYINDKPDGRFPGHEPNPLEAENRKQLTGTVMSHACDIGLLFDGDADRITFIDEKGNFVSPDLIIALLGHYFSKKKTERHCTARHQVIACRTGIPEKIQRRSRDMESRKSIRSLETQRIGRLLWRRISRSLLFQRLLLFRFRNNGCLDSITHIVEIQRKRNDNVGVNKQYLRLFQYRRNQLQNRKQERCNGRCKELFLCKKTTC